MGVLAKPMMSVIDKPFLFPHLGVHDCPFKLTSLLSDGSFVGHLFRCGSDSGCSIGYRAEVY